MERQTTQNSQHNTEEEQSEKTHTTWLWDLLTTTIKCVVLAKEQTNRSMEQNRELGNRPANTVNWSLKRAIQWKKDSLSINGTGTTKQPHLKKKKNPSQILPLSPSTQRPPTTSFLGSRYVSALLEAANLSSLCPSSPFHVQPLPGEVKTLRARDKFHYQFQVFTQSHFHFNFFPSFCLQELLPGRTVFISCSLVLPSTVHRVEAQWTLPKWVRSYILHMPEVHWVRTSKYQHIKNQHPEWLPLGSGEVLGNFDFFIPFLLIWTS